MSNYGRAIKTIRATKGLNQKEMSKLLDISSAYLSRIENNQRTPTVDLIEKLSNQLNVPMHMFFLLAGGKDEVNGLPKEFKRKLADELLELLMKAEKEFGDVS